VEFAVQRHRSGETVLKAAMQGAALRFRPILMTSLAFIAGLVPLVFASGPGAIGNRTIGAASAGGMILGTIFGVLLIPGLYYVFGKISERRLLVKDENENPLTEEIDHHTEREKIEHYV
jgi:HAE1 family hydrophobic/amphiphilic exporter-1